MTLPRPSPSQIIQATLVDLGAHLCMALRRQGLLEGICSALERWHCSCALAAVESGRKLMLSAGPRLFVAPGVPDIALPHGIDEVDGSRVAESGMTIADNDWPPVARSILVATAVLTASSRFGGHYVSFVLVSNRPILVIWHDNVHDLDGLLLGVFLLRNARCLWVVYLVGRLLFMGSYECRPVRRVGIHGCRSLLVGPQSTHCCEGMVALPRDRGDGGLLQGLTLPVDELELEASPILLILFSIWRRQNTAFSIQYNLCLPVHLLLSQDGV